MLISLLSTLAQGHGQQWWAALVAAGVTVMCTCSLAGLQRSVGIRTVCYVTLLNW